MSAAPVDPMSPAGRAARARRTDAIVAALRDHVPPPDDPRDVRNPARAACVDDLIEANLEVARTLAARYRNRGIDLDDLEQVAFVGLTKAAHRFDPHAGYDFLAYAVPTIRGEVRRHFRDCGWAVRPPRRVQDMQRRIAAAQGELMLKLGRSPRPSDVAAYLEVDLADVQEALAADGCFSPASLDSPASAEGASTLGDFIVHGDNDLGAAEARVILEPLLRQLCPRDQRIVQLRFYEERTQQEIAEDVGVNQAQVSRILFRILRELRGQLGDPADGHDHPHKPPAA
ncbi:sigma-70 family RNA polymerase sigma factor [Nocardioides sp. GCM10028917]|uniref:sigma-70 family RNA polymerase sigma factor n=1 Tax=Nocardioides sp. GCM10028917 TaxID=3273408 RepID=UPI003623CFB4